MAQSKLILADYFVDGVDGQVRTKQAGAVADGRITAVGDQATLQQAASLETDIIDLGAVYLAPGLIDGHTHASLAGDGRSYAEMFVDSDEIMLLAGVMNLRKHLQAGITTACEHGARNRVGFELKEGLRRGYFPGPRLLVSGRPITCTGGHFHFCNEIADGEAEVRRSVRRLVHEGVDYVKIMASGGGTEGTFPGRASYSVAELHAAVHEAHHFDRLTVAHCRAKESMRRAVEAGIDLMEHAEFLDPDHQLRFDPKIAEMMAEAGIWVSPTLQATTRYPRLLELWQRRDADQLTPAETRELAALEAHKQHCLDILRRMLDYDMRDRIVPGTNSGVASLAFGHLDYELRLLVEVGFTPAEVLIAATKTTAEAIGTGSELGTIEVGKAADFVAFDGDPTTAVMAISRVAAVFLGGESVTMTH